MAGQQELDDTPPRGVGSPSEGNAALDRAALIELCVYALDRARSRGVTERIESGLAEVGVSAVRPDGERFDAAVHEAGGVLATAEAELDGVIAETELAGFTDRGAVLRVPVVTVYQHG